jgi:spore germination cell wall hydrolase CwlJ-like protein
MKLTTAIAIILILGVTSLAIEPATADTSGELPVNELFTKVERPQLYCLAKNIYFEARSDNLAGRYAVADVVLNRVKDRRYPETICKVIHQGEKDASGNMKKNRCQFSWYCDGVADIALNQEKWNEAQTVAFQIVTKGSFRGLTEGANHYHATYVNPSWNKSMDYIGQIGAHKFFRSR